MPVASAAVVTALSSSKNRSRESDGIVMLSASVPYVLRVLVAPFSVRWPFEWLVASWPQATTGGQFWRTDRAWRGGLLHLFQRCDWCVLCHIRPICAAAILIE